MQKTQIEKLLEAIKNISICGRVLDNEPTPMKGCNQVDCDDCGVRSKIAQYILVDDVLGLFVAFKKDYDNEIHVPKRLFKDGKYVERIKVMLSDYVIVPRKQLEDYINFVDNLRTHPKSHVMLVKYQIYKELLEEKTK